MKNIYTIRKDKKRSSTSFFWNYSWREWTCTLTEKEFKNFLKSHGIKFKTKDFSKKQSQPKEVKK